MRKILECLAELAGRNLNVSDTAEALRADLIPLLLQRLVPHNDVVPVITLEPNFENLLINADRQNQQEELILDVSLSQTLITQLSNAVDQQLEKSKAPFLIVSPSIRRKLAKLVRAQLIDLNVLSFTELPETKRVEVVATIGNAAEEDQ